MASPPREATPPPLTGPFSNLKWHIIIAFDDSRVDFPCRASSSSNVALHCNLFQLVSCLVMSCSSPPSPTDT